jgi:uncharacterized membrane protein
MILAVSGSRRARGERLPGRRNPVNLIEETDRRQQRLWRVLLVALLLALALLTVRYLFGTVYQEHGLNSRPIGIAVLGLTVVFVITMLVACVRLGLIAARAKADPRLREALLDDELVQRHLAQSWKAGFIGAVATPFVFLLISSFHPFDDLLLVALTTGSVGAGAFLTAFHVKSST